MAGKRYSAGAIFLQVVPVFANVQRAIEDEAKNIDRALGDQMERSGDRAGERAGKAAAEGIQREVKKLDIGKDLEKQFSDSVKGIDKALDGINTKNLGKKLRSEVAGMKAELASLSDVDIKVDDNFDKVSTRVAALRTQLEAMRKRSTVLFDTKGLPEVYRALAQAEAAIKGIDGTIKLDVDTKPAERKMGAFERDFKKTTKRAAESLSTSVNKEARKLGDELKYLQNLRIGVDISSNRARAELAEIRRDVEKLSSEEVEIDAKIDAMGALAELTAFEAALRKIDGEDVEVDVKVNGKNGLNGIARDGEDAANSFRSFNIVLLAATSAGPALVPVLAAIAGGLLALGPAAAVGTFGLASVLVGFSGIGNALGALQSQQDAAATNAQTNAGRQVSSANQIADAVRAVADAERNAARAAEDAAERVADARRNAARAAEDAAERVADAREQAAESIKDAVEAEAEAQEQAAEDVENALERQKDAQKDYRDAVQDVADAEQALRDARAEAEEEAATLADRQRKNALDERVALADLFDAQVEYNAVMADGSATDVDKERAWQNLEGAQIALNDTRNEQVALAEEAADYAKNGVEGNENVQTAQERLTSAIEAQTEALEDQEQAAADVRAAQIDAQEAIAEAAKNTDEARRDGAEMVSDALEDQSEVLSDNARAVRQALEDQAESAADSARAVDRAKEALGRARDAQDDLNTSINSQQQAVDNAMGALGPAGQAFALYIFGLRQEWQAFRDDLQEAMLPSVQGALEGFFDSPNASKARTAMIVLAGAFGAFTLALSESFQGPVWGAFFEMLATTGPKIAEAFGGAFISLFEAFASILTVLAPYSLDFARGLEAMMGAFAGWTDSEAGVSGLTGFMDYAKEIGPSVIAAFVALAGAVANLLVAMLPYSEGILEVLTGFFNLIGDVAAGPLGAFVGGLLAVITASQIAYGVMNLLMAGGALLGSAIGLLVFSMVGLALAVYYVYRQNETLGTILGVVGGAILAVVIGMKAWWAISKLIASVQVGMAIATGANTAAITAQNTAAKIAHAVTKAWLGVQIAFNAVMMGNPLALFALALVALVAVLIYAWKNHEGFRNFVIDMWEKLKSAFWVAWGVLQTVFSAIGTAAMWLWENAIKPAFGFIGSMVAAVFAGIKAAWEKVLWPVIKTVGKIVMDLYQLYFKVALVLILAAWKALVIGVKWFWNNVLKPAWTEVKNAAVDLWNKHLGPAFSSIKSAWGDMTKSLKDAWDKYGQPILDWIAEKALPPFRSAWEDTINAIGDLWDGLKGMAAKPIKFMIEKIINEGIIDSFNKVADWVGKDGFDHIATPEWMANYATGGVLPGYTPGRDPHVFRSATAGTLALSGGEAIMRPEWTAAVGHGFVDQMNKIASSGGVRAVRGAMANLGGYWNGGVLPLFGASVKSHGSSYDHPAYDLNYPGYDDYGKPVGAWKAGILAQKRYVGDDSYGRWAVVNHDDGLASLYAHLSAFSELAVGAKVAAGQTIGYVGDLGNTGTPPTSHLHFEILNGGVGFADSGDGGKVSKPKRSIPGWLMGIVKDPLGAFKDWATAPLKSASEAVGKGSEMFSLATKMPLLLGKKVVDKVWDIVPGWVKTAAGWAGDATDWAVGGVKNAAGAVKDAGESVVGGIKDGAGAVGDFLGFADGGILPYNGTMMYDNGGYLPPGMTTVMNLTGKPEPVFTADQFEGLGIDGNGESFTYAPTINGSDLTAADLVDDIDFTRRKIQREGRYGRNRL